MQADIDSVSKENEKLKAELEKLRSKMTDNKSE
jgi:regulator of replication initiation timing